MYLAVCEALFAGGRGLDLHPSSGIEMGGSWKPIRNFMEHDMDEAGEGEGSKVRGSTSWIFPGRLDCSPALCVPFRVSSGEVWPDLICAEDSLSKSPGLRLCSETSERIEKYVDLRVPEAT